MLQMGGKATGAVFSLSPAMSWLVGWDPRESSEGLAKSLVEGLVAMGVDVRKVGRSHAGLAYLTKQQNAKAGVMITAATTSTPITGSRFLPLKAESWQMRRKR